jgi:hypothetical protein
MRNNVFFLKLFLILAAVISLNMLTRVIINDSFWGNKNLKIKDYLFERNENYNCAFIGSSLTQAQVIPEIIDSIAYKYHLKMFNLGASGTKPPESLYYCKYLIEKHERLKTIFIELVPFIYHLENEINSEFYYYFNLETFYIYQITNYCRSNNFKKWKPALRNFATSIKFSLYNLSNIEFLALVSKYNSKAFHETKQKGMSKSGFCGLEIIDEKELKINPEIFEKSLLGYQKAAKNKQVELNKSQILYLKYVNEINELCSQKGIDIYWVIPPGGYQEIFKFILPIYSMIDNNKKMNLADPNKYDKFYDLSLHHDKLHFNIEGSKQYSAAIANEYISLKDTFNNSCLKN